MINLVRRCVTQCDYISATVCSQVTLVASMREYRGRREGSAFSSIGLLPPRVLYLDQVIQQLLVVS